MCAEAALWRGHRFLLADALLPRGIAVEPIQGASQREPHARRAKSPRIRPKPAGSFVAR